MSSTVESTGDAESIANFAEEIVLRIEPLSRQAFAPFGEVIEASDAVRHFPIDGGMTERYHDLANLDLGQDGRAVVSIFRSQPRRLPFTISRMERPLSGSQTIVPLCHLPYLIVVAPAGERVATQALRCFITSGVQGVNYAAGTWRHPLVALHTVSDFLVIDRGGSEDDCEEAVLDPVALIPDL